MENNRIIIYGAGTYATIFLRYLFVNEQNQLVDFAVVSDENHFDALYSVPIYSYDKAKKIIGSQTIYVAVKDSEDIIVELKKDGFEDVVCITSNKIQEYTCVIQKWVESNFIRNKILFYCYEGKGYECNCKYISNEIIDRKLPVELLWAVREIGEYDFPKEVKQVKIDSLEYFGAYSTAGIIVANTGTPLSIMSNRGYYINTWHGTGPFKKAGISCESENEYKQAKKNVEKISLYISNSLDNTQMFRESFFYNGEIMECGNPRNDILFNNNKIKEKVYGRLGINKDKHLVLYAPTFREDVENSIKKYDLDMCLVLNSLYRRFDAEYILLYRAHHFLKNKINENICDIGIDVTNYPDVMELLVASDVLITDYSSIMWDFSLQRKPVFLYHNDATEYADDRGFYWPVSRWPYIKAHTTEEMCEKILNYNHELYIDDLERFFKEDPSYDDGHASERVVDRIEDVIINPSKYGKE